MLSRNIKLENFKKRNIQNKLISQFKNLISKKNDQKNLINSFSKSYSCSYNKHQLKKYKKYDIYQVFGMGGSSLGSQAIYDFIKTKIKKKFYFFDNLDLKNKAIKHKKKSFKYNYIKVRKYT